MPEDPLVGKSEEEPQVDFARQFAQLLRDARSMDSSLRGKAVVEIGALAPAMHEALDAVVLALDDADSSVRLTALQILADNAEMPVDSRMEFRDALSEDRLEVRLAAIRKLGRLLPQVAAVIPAMKSEDSPPVAAPTEELREEPMEHPGKWIAYERQTNALIAIADTYAAVMKRVAASGAVDPVVKRAPSADPQAMRQPSALLDDESPKIIDDVREMIPDPERWLDTPHAWFGGRKPRELIGTEDEQDLRNLLRGIRYGITA